MRGTGLTYPVSKAVGGEFGVDDQDWQGVVGHSRSPQYWENQSGLSRRESEAAAFENERSHRLDELDV